MRRVSKTEPRAACTAGGLEKEMGAEEKRPRHETQIKNKKNVMSWKAPKRKHFKERTINPCQTLQRLFVTEKRNEKGP